MTRAMGTLVFDEGVIIYVYPNRDDATDIVLAPGRRVGAIVREAESGRWRYDKTMRQALGIVEDPDFETDLEAGNRLEDFLPPLPQVNAMARLDRGGIN